MIVIGVVFFGVGVAMIRSGTADRLISIPVTAFSLGVVLAAVFASGRRVLGIPPWLGAGLGAHAFGAACLGMALYALNGGESRRPAWMVIGGGILGTIFFDGGGLLLLAKRGGSAGQKRT